MPFGFYLVALKNMKQFERVTCRQEETGMFLRFLCERASALNGNDGLLTPSPLTVRSIGKKPYLEGLLSVCYQCRLASHHTRRAPPCMSLSIAVV